MYGRPGHRPGPCFFTDRRSCPPLPTMGNAVRHQRAPRDMPAAPLLLRGRIAGNAPRRSLLSYRAALYSAVNRARLFHVDRGFRYALGSGGDGADGWSGPADRTTWRDGMGAEDR